MSANLLEGIPTLTAIVNNAKAELATINVNFQSIKALTNKVIKQASFAAVSLPNLGPEKKAICIATANQVFDAAWSQIPIFSATEILKLPFVGPELKEFVKAGFDADVQFIFDEIVSVQLAAQTKLSPAVPDQTTPTPIPPVK